MSTPDPLSEPEIKKLHDLFCEKTSVELEFDFTRLRQWYEWLTFRKTKPFTPDDLWRVIGYIKQGMHKGSRYEGALRFTNLICNPHKFEEELSLALGAMKAKATTERKGNYVPVVPPPLEERATVEDMRALMKGARASSPHQASASAPGA